jgi:hypothetical protein
MRFLARPKPGSDKSPDTVVYDRRIFVRNRSIDVVALLQQRSASTPRVWVSESILPVCADSFKGSKKFRSISFGSNSRFTRIESKAFSQSSLQSIMIPSQVQSINGSAFLRVNLLSCLIESDNRRFVFENAFLRDALDHKLTRNSSGSSHITNPHDIEMLGSSCFRWCESLSSSAE